jgi:hypothetical protein
MDTVVNEIAERIYRLSTFVPGAGPAGFTFNQFLVDADQPSSSIAASARYSRPSRRRLPR